MTENNNSADRPKKKSKSNYRKRNNRKRYKASGNKSNDNATNKTDSESGGSNKRRNQNNRNRRPKSLTPARILQKYDNLLDQYIVARKKFFDLFGRNNQKQLPKVEKNYQNSLKSLREFEVKLEDWQREVLDKKINAYAEDREFSKNHDLKPEGDIVSFTGEFEDPHLLATQKAAQESSQWSKDTEESQGTIEDYQKYKDSY